MQKQVASIQTLPSILICGYERGGTTLLAELFRSNGYESGFECGVLMCDTPKEFLNYKPYVDMLVSGWGIQVEDIQEICSSGFEQFYQQLIEKSNPTIKGCDKYFDKTPIYMSKLGRVLHRTNFINKACVIHRDPRSIFTSWAKRAGPKEEVESNVLKFLDNYCKRYVNYFLGCAAHLPNPNVLFISYEELCLNEADYYKKIGMFVEGNIFKPRESPSRFINVEGVGMDLSKVFSFREFLSEQTQSEILRRTQLASPFFANEERINYGSLWDETISKINVLRTNYKIDYISTMINDTYFEPTTYLLRHQDVLDAGANPVLHYINHGVYEGRSPG